MFNKKISIIIPIYNEECTLKNIINQVSLAELPEGLERELILVDDCSTDSSREIIKSYVGKHTIVLKDKNEGKGVAVKDGLKEATGDFFIIQDADLEYDPREYKLLLEPLLKDQADIVYGSRFLGGRPHRILYFWHYAGNKFLTLLSNMFTNINLTDMETCYKCFNQKVRNVLISSLSAKRFSVEPEITAIVAKKHFRISEVSISYSGRTYAEGKHITWKDGVSAICNIIYFNVFKEYSWKSLVKRKLKLILFVAFILSISYSFFFNIHPSVDALAYHKIANNIVNGNGFREDLSQSVANDLAIIRVGPGYQYFIASWYYIFGDSYQLLWFVHAILLVISGYLIFLITNILFKNNSVSLLAVFFYVFFVDIWQANSMLLTENLYLPLLIFLFYLFLKNNEKITIRRELIFSIILGLTILTRPTILLYYLFLIIYWLINKRYRIILVSLAVIIMVAPWTYRNYKIYNSFVLTTAAGGYDLWIGNNLESNGELEPTPEIVNYFNTYHAVETDKYGIEQYKNFLLKHPVSFVKLQIIKTIKYFSAIRVSAFWFHLHGLPRFLIGAWSGFFSLILFSLGSLGVWIAMRKKINIWPLIIFTISAPLSVIPIIVENRYRWPIYPFLAIFSALAVYEIYRKKVAVKYIVVAVFSFCLIIVLDVLLSYNDVIAHLKNIF